MIVLVYAINKTGNFSYLDTFISENHTTFRDIVGIALIKFCIENIFKYNNFGGKAMAYQKPNTDTLPVETDENIGG